MQVEELMTKSVQCCHAADSLELAANIMWRHDCGCVPVCAADESTGAIGVLTDRDICMCALFKGKPLREISVGDAMARKIVSVRPHDSIAAAEQTMSDAQIRRLPVIDDRGALVGILSLSDIARATAPEQTGSRRQATDLEVSDTLAAICQPSGASAAA
ncbi:MAG: CBS domain-containing protein [Steroidobacteraceae bacterium]